MKKLVYLFVFLVTTLGPISAIAEMKIHNSFLDGEFYYVIVEYTNDTKETYRAVTIKCKLLDSSENIINFNKRSFFSHEHGPIKPGFKDVVKIPIETLGKNVESISCGGSSM